MSKTLSAGKLLIIGIVILVINGVLYKIGYVGVFGLVLPIVGYAAIIASIPAYISQRRKKKREECISSDTYETFRAIEKSCTFIAK